MSTPRTDVALSRTWPTEQGPYLVTLCRDLETELQAAEERYSDLQMVVGISQEQAAKFAREAHDLEKELQAARAEVENLKGALKFDNDANEEQTKELVERAERAEQALAEAKIDVTRYRYWRENIDWLTEDEAGIKGCAYSCQIPLEIIKQASDAELFDAVADFEIEQAARAARSGA